VKNSFIFNFFFVSTLLCFLTKFFDNTVNFFGLIVQEEIEVEGKLLRAGKSVGVVSVDFRKKKTGKLMAQARHTKYLVASSKL
jgi:acyl-coenzyme A thioesterase 13